MKLRSLFGSVRARITLASMVLAAIALIVASLVILELVERDLIDAAEATLDETIAAVEENETVAEALEVEQFGVFEVETGVGELIYEAGLLADEGLIEGVLFDFDGEIVGFLSFDAETEEIVEAVDLADQPLPGVFVPDDLGEIAESLQENAVTDVRELSESSLSEIRESVDSVRGVLTVVVPVIVALLGLFTWFLVGRALRPVDAITRRVAAISGATLAERVPVPAAEDEVAELAVVMNEMLARLEAASSRQQQFVADASHELRSPLSTIKAAAEVGGLDPGNTRAQRMATDIVAEADRMEAMIADLLDLARLDEDRRAPTAPTDLAAIVGRIVDRSPAGAVQVEVSSEPAPLHGVESQLERVVQNLLDNARTHASARVRLTVGPQDTEVRLLVEDDGPGIAEGDRDRVFERFVRLDDARARADGGSGLGLALVRSIVDRHGGRIDVSSSHELRGAAIEVVLPV